MDQLIKFATEKDASVVSVDTCDASPEISPVSEDVSETSSFTGFSGSDLTPIQEEVDTEIKLTTLKGEEIIATKQECSSEDKQISSTETEIPAQIPAQETEDFVLNEFDISLAIDSFSWSGRFQHIKEGENEWFLDGAHNEMSVPCAADWFADCVIGKKDMNLGLDEDVVKQWREEQGPGKEQGENKVFEVGLEEIMDDEVIAKVTGEEEKKKDAIVSVREVSEESPLEIRTGFSMQETADDEVIAKEVAAEEKKEAFVSVGGVKGDEKEPQVTTEEIDPQAEVTPEDLIDDEIIAKEMTKEEKKNEMKVVIQEVSSPLPVGEKQKILIYSQFSWRDGAEMLRVLGKVLIKRGVKIDHVIFTTYDETGTFYFLSPLPSPSLLHDG